MHAYIKLVPVKRHSAPNPGRGTFLGTLFGTFFVSQLYIRNQSHYSYMGEEIKMAYRVTTEQKKVLEARAKAEGYSKVAFYVRAVLFLSIVIFFQSLT
jgi:hypothetical protein